MITINTNTTAMVAQNNLNTTQSNMNSSMLKLSTGLRINSAADDAAGMQISNRMETQINGLGVAQRNANDAISMAQTAEGAMTETTDMLNRMRDLSLQAANDTNTTDDRLAMQKEVNALATEIQSVSEKTDFAGINLLDGSGGAKSDGTFTFQVGADASETISFSIAAMGVVKLGVGTVATADAAAKPAVAAQPETSTGAGDAVAAVAAVAAVKQGDVQGLSVTTAANAQATIKTLDTALATVDAQRADLGAVQNRLESTIDNLGNIEQNMSASQSRIKDVDFAKETTNMTSQQMMMQAGSTILSQAKSLPQYATQLLG